MAESNVYENRKRKCFCCDPPFLLTSSDLTDHVYSMDYPKKGLCLIFSHREFDEKKEKEGKKIVLNERKGSHYDKKRLEKLFKKLNFEVLTYEDNKKEDIKKILNIVSRMDFSKYGCFVCCFSTHGRLSYEDNICLWAKDQDYLLDDVLSYFYYNSDSLKGKPKIFITQSCLGNGIDDLDYGQKIIFKKNGPSLSSYSSNQSCNVEKTFDSTDKEENFSSSLSIPLKSDFLIICSTYFGCYSFSSPKGSPFIAKLCAKIESKYAEMDFLSILTLVNHEMAYEYESQSLKKDDDRSKNRKKQMPFYKSSLTKMIRF